VEEIGRIKPRTVSELMEIDNRFADREDAYNNKSGRSPEVDKSSRQKRRYRNSDNHGRRNQIAAVIVVKQHMPWDGLNGGRTRCWRIRERGAS
jgi:hypothetical protein